ncbi:hypothetical protein HUW46_03186 [Amycolatopsis sp. CA-230715]|nr:hypothetical protein HUW46_03186 [Amycolatopsis sp. CA-230715]
MLHCACDESAGAGMGDDARLRPDALSLTAVLIQAVTHIGPAADGQTADAHR